MAAIKKGSAKGKGALKGIHGRMPTKRTINLALIDENKISPFKAVPGILLIVVLAALFSKYLVADRLIAVSQAQSRTAQLRNDLQNVTELVQSFGDVEETYAHYTLDGMTQDELGLVDRTQVLELVSLFLPVKDSTTSLVSFNERVSELFDSLEAAQDRSLSLIDFHNRLGTVREIKQTEKAGLTWTVTGNMLTVEMAGRSLEALNQLARRVEEEAIVDSCTITTANKNSRAVVEGGVWGRFMVYLRQPPEEEAQS